MWAIWHNRNLVVFEGVRKEPQYTAYVAQRYLAEFMAVQEGGMAGPKGPSVRWKPPAVGRFKLNADGALFKEASCVGFGVMVRDHEGQIIAAASKRKIGLFNVPYIEAMAIQFAAEFARDLDLRDVDLEGDNLEVIAALNSRTLMEERKSNSYNNNNRGKEDGIDYMGNIPVHSQVRKIKQESEKIIDWSPGQPEMRPPLREITRQPSRSRLGLGGRPITVGDS
ncbi:hypothetical protein L1049_027798 [Liquidambar formosana]|uniref:RNase H type-1 domain-containing protein n=2 Tax=Liquidambar formosana TaxID=63359 RepID=A0AAP0RLJ0_LIQFO